MIIWINGTFGSGKTTTGALLADRHPQLRTFDPEWVGFMLRNNLPDHDVTDFQQFESWRRLVPVVADEIARATGQTLVAVQSVLDANYWDEIESGLASLGHEVLHVVLEAEERVMRRRIDSDEVERGARQWRLDHLPTYAAARPWLVTRADLLLDTTALTPQEAADLVVDAVNQRVASADEP